MIIYQKNGREVVGLWFFGYGDKLKDAIPEEKVKEWLENPEKRSAYPPQERGRDDIRDMGVYAKFQGEKYGFDAQLKDFIVSPTTKRKITFTR